MSLFNAVYCYAFLPHLWFLAGEETFLMDRHTAEEVYHCDLLCKSYLLKHRLFSMRCERSHKSEWT